MENATTEPRLQFYAGNFMEGKDILKSDTRNEYRTAVSKETQHLLDSPHQLTYPTTIIDQGKFSNQLPYIGLNFER